MKNLLQHMQAVSRLGVRVGGKFVATVRSAVEQRLLAVAAGARGGLDVDRASQIREALAGICESRDD
jgi:hypothetical protein